jgi:hypothetical protein
MTVTCLYICFIVSVGSLPVPTGNLAQEVAFDAVKCDDIRNSAAYSGRSFCDESKIKKEYGVNPRTTAGTYTVVQRNPNRKFKAVKCEKKISTITAVCGAFSHSKLITPPDILLPVQVSMRECRLILVDRQIMTEDQRQIPITVGSTVTYKYVDTGSVTLSEGNVDCEGGEIKLQGKKHENILKLVTVNFRLVEIDVRERKNRLRTEEGVLPRVCNLADEGCALDSMTIIFDTDNLNMCAFAAIRTAVFEGVTTEGAYNVINDEHKLMFELKDSEAAPLECKLSTKLRKTNFERVYLIPGESPPGMEIDPSAVDLELEARVSDYYLAHWSLTAVQESEVKWQAEVCQLIADKMGNDQTIMHDGHVLKLQGEVINEFPCTKVRVRTRIGHRMEGEACLDHLPVFLSTDEVAYMTPLTRVLVSRDAVMTVNCSVHYPYIYEDTEGKLVTANPSVQILDIKLSDHHFLDANHRNHSEVFSFSSLLYTKEEVQAYESMIQGHAGERAVERKFASYYCAETGECAPSRSPQNFHWDKLLNPEELMMEWWENLKGKIMWWGIIWACVDSVVTMAQLAAKLVLVCRNVGNKQLTRSAIFRFVFLPGQELINMFPNRQETGVGEEMVNLSPSNE